MRCTDASFAQALFGALRAHRVRDVDAPPNYSVKVADDASRGRATGFHLLYRSSALVLRTRDARRLASGVCNYLASHAPYDPGLFVLSGVVVAGEHGAVVAPSGLRPLFAHVERRLNVRGLRIVDAPWVLLDTHTGDAVVPEPPLTIDWSAFDALPAPRRADPPVPPGRYRVVGWAVAGDGPVSRAQAVAQATRAVVDFRAAQEVLDGLARVMARVAPATVRLDDPASVAATIADLAGP